MSLQRRRERYCIIQVWKILNGHAPRQGVKAIIPSIDNGTQSSVRTDYDNSFTVRGTQLWNAIPAEVSTLGTLEALRPEGGVNTFFRCIFNIEELLKTKK